MSATAYSMSTRAMMTPAMMASVVFDLGADLLFRCSSNTLLVGPLSIFHQSRVIVEDAEGMSPLGERIDFVSVLHLDLLPAPLHCFRLMMLSVIFSRLRPPMYPPMPI